MDCLLWGQGFEEPTPAAVLRKRDAGDNLNLGTEESFHPSAKICH